MVRLFSKGCEYALRALICLAEILFLCLNLSCAKHEETGRSAAKPPLTPALFKTGRILYERQCAACHGLTGAGDGPAAYLLSPKPRDFTRNEFRLVSTNSMAATDEDLFATITRGMPGSAMPSWESFAPRERWALVYYVRHLTGVSEPIDSSSIIQVPPEAPRTPEGIERGRQIFAQACASCHGPLGKGDGKKVMQDNAGFPIRPRDLTAGVFKGSSESQDLYKRIVAGLPGSPMPGYAGVYTDEQIWDLVHHVQSLIPPGVEGRVRMHHGGIKARRVRGDMPLSPAAQAWREAEPVSVALTPLWWRNERAEGIEVRALHNGKELAVHLSWNDSTLDNNTLAPQSFSDGVAVQFSTEKDPPFFGMGDQAGVVQIWHWKASWQEDLGGWKDVEARYPNAAADGHPAAASQDLKSTGGWGADNPLSDPRRPSAAEEAMAKGLGTLTSKPLGVQRVQAQGVWQDGRWQVVLHRPMASNEKGDLRLRPGQAVRVAFAVWDGHAGDRNGQKSVSIWNDLHLER